MAQYTSYLTRALCRKCLVFLRINGPINGKTSIHVVACVASVSVRFKSKEQGTRVKDRAAKKEDPVLFISFYSLNRVKGMNYQYILKQPLHYLRNHFLPLQSPSPSYSLQGPTPYKEI